MHEGLAFTLAAPRGLPSLWQRSALVPEISTRSTKANGFTLVEIIIVVGIIGLLAAIVYPAYSRARRVSQTDSCINNLRQITGAKDQYAMANHNQTPSLADLVTSYISREPVCLAGGSYIVGALGVQAECNISGHTY